MGGERGGEGVCVAGGVCPGKWTQILENEVHCPGFVRKNYGMYDTYLRETKKEVQSNHFYAINIQTI